MLLFNVDGPKGSGKSTLAKALSEKYQADHKYFDSKRVVTDDDFSLQNLLVKDVVFERGMMSYMIYGFLWNAQQEFEVVRSFNEMQIKTWVPMSSMHFEKLFSTIKYKMIVLYSSDDRVLEERINYRESTTGKGASDLERSQLKDSNMLFKQWGEYFKYKYPDKILLIDVSQHDNIESILNEIERSVK